MSADAAMAQIVEPGYAAAIEEAQRKIGRNMALAERTLIASTVVDETAMPVRAMRDDLRLRTKDIANRARAQAMMEAVFGRRRGTIASASSSVAQRMLSWRALPQTSGLWDWVAATPCP